LSTIDRPERLSLPPLVPGQRLDRVTFHERYAAMPPNVRAELIGGIVSMWSPLWYGHGGRDQFIAGWIFHYQTSTPGTDGASNTTTIFEDYGEHQPDQSLWITEDRGGRSRLVEGFIEGVRQQFLAVSWGTPNNDPNGHCT